MSRYRSGGQRSFVGDYHFMDIVDSQIHAFYTLGLNETMAAMDALGIQAAMIDEFWSYTKARKLMPNVELGKGVLRPVSPLAQAAAIQHPDRISFVHRVERKDPDLQAVFTVLGSMPGCRSIRIIVRGSVEHEAFVSGGYNEVLQLAKQYGLPVSVHGNEVASALNPILKRYPEVKFVLDHCGAPESTSHWNEILRLGKTHPNIWLKWSHAHHVFQAGPYPYVRLQAQLVRAIAAFGKERVIWASDFTHERSGASWAELLFYIRDSAELSTDVKEWLFAKAARSLYRWPAPDIPFEPPHFARLKASE